MALTDGLLSYFKLDEASGTRADSAGSNTLSTLNAPGNQTGKISNALALTRSSSQGLQIVDASQSPDLSIAGASGDLTVAGWVSLASKPAGQMAAVAKYDFSAGNREYWLYWDNTLDRFQFQVFNSVATSDTVTANNFGAPSTSTFYFLVATVDNTANTINISVNDGTVNSTALTVTTHDGTAPFNLGYTGNSGSPFTFWDGALDEIGVWNRVLSASEITTLYNSGTGLTHPFTLSVDATLWLITA